MDYKKIREESLQKAMQLGYKVNENLPLLDVHLQKDLSSLITRTLILNCVVATAYGFDKKRALNWLSKENLINFLSESENSFFSSKKNDFTFKYQIESLWALVWALNFFKELDFSKYCGESLISFLPNLKDSQDSKAFIEKATLRSEKEIIQTLDLSYCLHWAIRNSEINNQHLKIQPYVIMQRRKALEWLCSDSSWDDVNLDT
jgi:hypothetical protein